MVSRVQARVVQQGLPERRVTARSARPSTLALLGRPLSSAEAHRFLLVGGGHQYVMTLITRIGINGVQKVRPLWSDLLAPLVFLCFAGIFPVGAVGLEPTLLIRTRILSPVRLPIPPRPRDSVGSITASHPCLARCSSGLPGRDGRGAGWSIRRRGSGWSPRCVGP